MSHFAAYIINVNKLFSVRDICGFERAVPPIQKASALLSIAHHTDTHIKEQTHLVVFLVTAYCFLNQMRGI